MQLVDPGWVYGLASDRERPWRGLVTNDGWKYVVLEGQPWLMYNLKDDPCELVDLALDGRFKKERQNLQDKLTDWITRTGDYVRIARDLIFSGWDLMVEMYKEEVYT